MATAALTLRLAVEPWCTTRPTPKAHVEPENVLRGDAVGRLTLGNEAALRALAWIRLAVDASYEPLSAPGLSWEFGQLDAVTTLDRNFTTAYPFGSSFLSTFRRDQTGALRILEKWVRYEPTSWRSHAALGYHWYFELDRPNEATPHLLRAATMEGAPAWLAAMGARVLSESEKLPQQIRRLVDLYPRVPEGVARERLASRIRAVRLRYETQRLENALAAYHERHRRNAPALGAVEPFLEPPSRALASLDDVSPDDPGARRELAALFAERFPFRYDASKGVVRAEVSNPELEKLGVHRTPGGSAKNDAQEEP